MEGASTPRLRARSLRAAGVVCSILLLTNNRSAILAKTEAAEGPGWETPLRCKPELWRDAVVPESSSGRHCGAVWVCWGLPGHIHLVLGGCRAPCPSPPQTHSALQAFTTPSSSQPLPCAAPEAQERWPRSQQQQNFGASPWILGCTVSYNVQGRKGAFPGLQFLPANFIFYYYYSSHACYFRSFLFAACL